MVKFRSTNRLRSVRSLGGFPAACGGGLIPSTGRSGDGVRGSAVRRPSRLDPASPSRAAARSLIGRVLGATLHAEWRIQKGEERKSDGRPPISTIRYSLFAIRHSFARPAFSLAELIVAIGVLVLMFSLAGQVFSLTIRSTGQATALTTVTQMLRAFEDTLREDLRHVERGQSLIWIQGNPVNAYWTRSGREADDDANTADAGPATGYPHPSDPSREYGPEEPKRVGNLVPPRADILMFTTARPSSSLTLPSVTAGQQLVVYGHAITGEYALLTKGATSAWELQIPNADDPQRWPFPMRPLGAGLYPSDQSVSSVPAEEWLLSRRNVLLVPTDPPSTTVLPACADTSASPCSLAPTTASGVGDPALLTGQADVFWAFPFDQLVVRPPSDIVDRFQLPRVFSGADPASRSLLDPTPPASLAPRFGQYFLPHCASFQVEWALDPRSEFVAGRLDGMKEMLWIDPGAPDPLHGLEAKLPPKFFTEPTGTSGDAFSLQQRFRGTKSDPDSWFGTGKVKLTDGRPNVAFFGAQRCADLNGDDKCGPLDQILPDPVSPAALRITVDLFDSERRLERPIRHVMVIPVGG